MSRLGAPLEVGSRELADAVHVLSLAGDLVVTSRDALRYAVERALEAGGRTVVVDAERVTHVDTPSFALLVQLAGRCRERGGDLVVVGLPQTFASLAEALHLEEAMSFAGSLEAALERPGE